MSCVFMLCVSFKSIENGREKKIQFRDSLNLHAIPDCDYGNSNEVKTLAKTNFFALSIPNLYAKLVFHPWTRVSTACIDFGASQ